MLPGSALRPTDASSASFSGVSEAVPFAGFGGAGAIDNEDEDDLLQQALQMSMREIEGADSARVVSTAEESSAAEVCSYGA